MSANPIRLFPDPALRKAAEPVTAFDSSLAALIRHLEQTMRSQPSGIGIAAPQIGICRKVAIVDVSSRDPEAKRLIMVNPMVLAMENERPSREGCMSIPEYTGLLKRAEFIHVSWQDENGIYHEKRASGIEAVCMQHEIDHLNGILFIDRVTSLKRDLIPRPLKSRSSKPS